MDAAAWHRTGRETGRQRRSGRDGSPPPAPGSPASATKTTVPLPVVEADAAGAPPAARAPQSRPAPRRSRHGTAAVRTGRGGRPRRRPLRRRPPLHRPRLHPSPPAAGEPAAGEKPSFWRRRRWWIVTAAVLLVLAGALVGFMLWVRTQYYVGAYHGNVAIYRGIDASVLGVNLHSVDAVFNDLPVSSLPPYDQQDLESGYAASTKQKARQHRRPAASRSRPRAARPAVPLPVPSPSASPSASASLPVAVGQPVRTGRGRDAVTATLLPTRSGRRGLEAGMLVFAALLATGAFAAVTYAHSASFTMQIAYYGGGFVGLFLAAHLAVRRFAPYADPLLLPLMAALSGIGLAMIYRIDLANADSAERAGRSVPSAFAPLQMMWTLVAVGLFVGVLVVVRDHRALARYSYTAGLVGILLLLLPAFPGIGASINGARLWLRLGPLTFQPSEISKLLLLIFFAGFLMRKRDVLSVVTRSILGIPLPRARDLGPVLIAWAASLGMLFLENDLGQGILVFGMFLAVLYVATERVSWIIIGLLLAGAGAVIAYYTMSHVQPRFEIWLHAFQGDNPHGPSYQLVQGLFGFANGGILGTGWGQGAPQIVPFANTDFMMSSLGEELGLDRRDGDLDDLSAARDARPARRHRGAGLLRQAARCRARVLAVPAGVHHRRRGHAAHPADRDHAAPAVLRRQLHSVQLHAGGPAGADQRRRPAAAHARHPAGRPGCRPGPDRGQGCRAGPSRRTGVPHHTDHPGCPERARRLRRACAVNRPIRKLAVACLLMFVALLVNANVVQVVEAQSLRNNPNNSRLLANRLNNDRGPIVVGNQAVAASVPTPDQTYKYQRTYPFGTLYPNVTGYFTVYTETGIEQSEDDVLSGTDDRLFLRRLADTLTGRQVRGGRVVLTLNQAAQQAAASGLAASGHPGAVVALDPRTGAVLAMATNPSYDPNPLTSHNGRTAQAAYDALATDPAQPLLNRAAQQTYPPGSTFKVVVTATALMSGRYTPETVIPAPPTYRLPGTNTVIHNAGEEICGSGTSDTLTGALTISCNTAFAGLGVELRRRAGPADAGGGIRHEQDAAWFPVAGGRKRLPDGHRQQPRPRCRPSGSSTCAGHPCRPRWSPRR